MKKLEEKRAEEIIKKLSKYIIVEILPNLSKKELKDINVSSFVSHTNGFFEILSSEKKLTFTIKLDY